MHCKFYTFIKILFNIFSGDLTFFLVATLHSGPCLETEEYCSVNLYYDPVCGSDYKIYTNMQSLFCVRQRQSRGKRR